ncbi:MAG: terminase small subunit [Clostridia bacterium]
MADKLTPKQQQFVREYLIDFNATQAAIRAGYSAKTAKQIGAENLTKLDIQAEIQRLGGKTAAKLEITRESIMQELAAIGFARTSDFVRVETEPTARLGIHPITGVVVNTPGGYCQTVRVTNTDDLPSEKAAALAGIKQGANGIEVKLHDKVRALELLGKAVGMFDSRETPVELKNNLFDAIRESAQEEMVTDDIPEIEQEAAAGTDMVEPSGIQAP